MRLDLGLDRWDWTAAAGVGLVASGIAGWSIAAALVWLGLACLGLSYIGIRASRGKKE